MAYRYTEKLEGTFERTIRKFIAMREPRKAFCVLVNGRFLSGVRSSHRTRSGRKYNKLLRLRYRLGPEWFGPVNFSLE